jgi:uncharacterized protein (DUF736 family)
VGQGQPRQKKQVSETLSKNKLGMVCKYVIPVTQEVEVGESWFKVCWSQSTDYLKNKLKAKRLGTWIK